MAFTVYTEDLFISTNEVGQVDTLVTDGVEDTYDVLNKDIADVGSTIQVSNQKKRLYDGGFEKNDDDTVTFNEVFPVGLQGVIPAVGTLSAAVYDTDSVPNVDDPRITEMSIIFGDLDDIHINYYVPKANEIGISISFVNLITSGGNPDLSIVQLACCNASGTALTYQATGTTLYTDQLAGFSTIAASGAAGVSYVDVVDAANGNFYFIAGDFIKINSGEPTQEIRRISSISTNRLNLDSALTFDHLEDETVYSSFREVKAKWTIPEGMTNGEAENFYNLVPKFILTERQRT